MKTRRKKLPNYKLRLGAKANKQTCGVKFVPEPLVKKGLLMCALRCWEAKHGIGLSPITRNASMAYWPKRKVAA